MKALVYHGPGHKASEEVPEPALEHDTGAIVRVDATTICGTDLHIMKGDVPEVTDGRILGHEAVGTVIEVGSGVKNLTVGNRVLVSCITACGACRFCRDARYGQCLGGGGWILGHLIDGTQAEYVRVPFADTSTYPVPDGVTDGEALMVADILPTGYEVGILNGHMSPGDVVAIVGAGPIGLSAVMGPVCTVRATSSRDRPCPSRLESAKQFGADVVVNPTDEDARTVISVSPTGWGPTSRSKRSGHRPRSSSRSASHALADISPTSVCTASQPRCTSRHSGRRTSPSRPDSSIRSRRRRS